MDLTKIEKNEIQREIARIQKEIKDGTAACKKQIDQIRASLASNVKSRRAAIVSLRRQAKG